MALKDEDSHHIPHGLSLRAVRLRDASPCANFFPGTPTPISLHPWPQKQADLHARYL
jgi:hypothetical protein